MADEENNVPVGDNAPAEGGNQAPDSNNNNGAAGEDNSGDGNQVPTNQNQEGLGIRGNNNANFHYQLRQANNKANTQNPSNSDGDGGEDDGSGGDQKNDLSTEVQKQISPFLEAQQLESDGRDIKTITDEYPEFSEYNDTVKAFAKHPSRVGVPIKTLYLEAIGLDNLLKIGAKRGAEATAKAATSGSGSGSDRFKSEKKVDDMNDKEFEAYQNQIRQG